MNRYKKPGAKKRGKKTGWAVRIKVAAAALAVAGVLVAVPYAIGYAYHRTTSMEVFSVTELQVSGLKHVAKEDLVRYAGDPSGRSIFAVDMAALVGSLDAHPWIKSASVKRELPGRLRLDVQERNPAAIALAASGRYLVDDEGAVLAVLDTTGWDYLPSIVYERSDSPSAPGAAPEAEVADALELLKAVRTEPSETLAGAVVHLGVDGLPYLMLDGAVVSVGTGGYGDKVRRLAEIFTDVRGRGVSPKTIDLRFPGKVVVDGDRQTGPEEATDNT